MQDALGDYTVLLNDEQLEAHVVEFKEVSAIIAAGEQKSKNEYLELLFGPQRLAYRVGCALIMRIEHAYGYEAVRDTIYLTGDRFISTYGHLLEDITS